MTELEKLNAGLVYDFSDSEVAERKSEGITGSERINQADQNDPEALERAIRSCFGSAGADPWVGPGFRCDYGKNIHVGDNFTANYNVVILDIAPVTIGDHVMIGPNTMISAVGHPLSPKKRRNYAAFAKPVTIGNDVWIGGNCTILPGVKIGNNVVVAAGAVITKDVPDNSLVGGVPAKVIRTLENDVRVDSEEGGNDDER